MGIAVKVLLIACFVSALSFFCEARDDSDFPLANEADGELDDGAEGIIDDEGDHEREKRSISAFIRVRRIRVRRIRVKPVISKVKSTTKKVVNKAGKAVN